MLLGLVLLMCGQSLLSHFRAQQDYLQKKGKRGEVVHSKVERYEATTGSSGRQPYSPSPLLWLFPLLHLVCAFAPHYSHSYAGFELTEWAKLVVFGMHLVWVLPTLAVAVQARSVWAGQAASTPVKKAE